MKIRIGIYGYGNLGKGVEKAALKNGDISLFGIFTKRDPGTVVSPFETPVYPAGDVLKYKNDIDVMVICGGSATELPVITPVLARDFNVIDSFDTHNKIPAHFADVEKAATASDKLAIVSCGWDPGLFSLIRTLSSSVLPDGNSYSFWGKGVSQGHGDAIRRIDGVIDARQYTIPVESAMERVRNGENPVLSAREKHKRECFVAVKEGYDKALIEKKIKEMPDYFADYDTTVNFVTPEELKKNHSALPHAGFVFRSGKTCESNSHLIEFSLKLDSNPEFTGSVLVAAARAAYRLSEKGERGCRTMADIPFSALFPGTHEELLKTIM